VRGHPVPDAREERGEAPDGGGLVREVEIERRRAEPDEAVSENDASTQRLPGEVWRGDRFGQGIEVPARVSQRQRRVRDPDREPGSGVREFREIFDLCPQPRERVVLDYLLRSPERDDVQADAGPLQFEQLVQDERLRQPREAVHDDGEVERACSGAAVGWGRGEDRQSGVLFGGGRRTPTALFPHAAKPCSRRRKRPGSARQTAESGARRSRPATRADIESHARADTRHRRV
jgi:hypothetical protein